jgi:hypothetical protein
VISTASLTAYLTTGYVHVTKDDGFLLQIEVMAFRFDLHGIAYGLFQYIYITWVIADYLA